MLLKAGGSAHPLRNHRRFGSEGLLRDHLMQSHPSCAAPSPFPAAPLRPQRKEGDFCPFQNLSLRSLRLPAAAPGVAEPEAEPGPFPSVPSRSQHPRLCPRAERAEHKGSAEPAPARAHGPPAQLTRGFLLLFAHDETAGDVMKKEFRF